MAWSIMDHADRDVLASALARHVAGKLSDAIAARGTALIAVSGGTTPGLFFEHLSQAAIDWERVTVTLVDDRCVPESSERSNAALVRRLLLRDAAADATFVPLHVEGRSITETSQQFADKRIDIAVLGMGNDGHTASLFPGGDRLEAALDPASTDMLIGMEAPGAGEPRVTFTLAALQNARHLALHIEGDDKRETFERAINGDSVAEMPVRALLHHPDTIVSIYWAPKT